MRKRHLLSAIAAGAALVVVGGCSSGSSDTSDSAPEVQDATVTVADSASPPQTILLTNDDGWDAPGIQATYTALTDAGFDVTMVAPAENQSGAGAGFAFTGDVTVQTHNDDPDMYSVTATPVGSLMFGLNELFKDDPPDLVVSGTNVGSNIGADTNYSGTVGAAVVAAGVYRLPTIALSTDTERSADGETGAYAETADLLVTILEDGLPDVPEGDVLNINYPVLADGAAGPNGYVYTPMSDKSQAAIGYQDNGDGTYTLQPARADDTPEAGSDWAELKTGNVTFTVLNANRTASDDAAAGTRALVSELNADAESAGAPAPQSGSGS